MADQNDSLNNNLDGDFEKQFTKDFRLTTAEIYYHMPDFPELLQSYVWQEGCLKHLI